MTVKPISVAFSVTERISNYSGEIHLRSFEAKGNIIHCVSNMMSLFCHMTKFDWGFSPFARWLLCYEIFPSNTFIEVATSTSNHIRTLEPTACKAGRIKYKLEIHSAIYRARQNNQWLPTQEARLTDLTLSQKRTNQCLCRQSTITHSANGFSYCFDFEP